MNSLHFSFVSLFPEMFAPLEHSILKRARDAGLLSFSHINPRDFALDKHRIVDDTPFGGGAGMVMKPDPIYRAVQSAKKAAQGASCSCVQVGRLFLRPRRWNWPRRSILFWYAAIMKVLTNGCWRRL